MQFVHAYVQENGKNIEDQSNDPMEEYNDANNTVEDDEEDGQIDLSRRYLIMSEWMMMETNLIVLMIYLYFRGKAKLLMKAWKQVFSFLYCCW